MSLQQALFVEILGTAALLFLILAIVDTRNAPPQSNLAPLVIGFLVVAIGMSIGVVSGYAINPARDFGPRVLAYFAGWGQAAFPGNGVGYSNYWWVPIVGPLVGGAVGVFVYDFTVHPILVARSTPTVGVEPRGETVYEEDRAGYRSEGRTVREDRTRTDTTGRQPEPTA
jgi:glycerol uptake facilitator protein